MPDLIRGNYLEGGSQNLEKEFRESQRRVENFEEEKMGSTIWGGNCIWGKWECNSPIGFAGVSRRSLEKLSVDALNPLTSI